MLCSLKTAEGPRAGYPFTYRTVCRSVLASRRMSMGAMRKKMNAEIQNWIDTQMKELRPGYRGTFQPKPR